jgi:hypothetical protein
MTESEPRTVYHDDDEHGWAVRCELCHPQPTNEGTPTQ